MARHLDRLPEELSEKVGIALVTDSLDETWNHLSSWGLSNRRNFSTTHSGALGQFRARTFALAVVQDQLCNFFLGREHSARTLAEKDRKAQILYAATTALSGLDKGRRKDIIDEILEDFTDYKTQDEINYSRDHYVMRATLAAALIKSAPHHLPEHLTQITTLRSDSRDSNTWSIGRDYNAAWSSNYHPDLLVAQKIDEVTIGDRIENIRTRWKKNRMSNANISAYDATEKTKIREITSIAQEIRPLYLEAKQDLECREQRDVAGDASRSRQALLNAIRSPDRSR